jgi:hypothetical protein
VEEAASSDCATRGRGAAADAPDQAPSSKDASSAGAARLPAGQGVACPRHSPQRRSCPSCQVRAYAEENVHISAARITNRPWRRRKEFYCKSQTQDITVRG